LPRRSEKRISPTLIVLLALSLAALLVIELTADKRLQVGAPSHVQRLAMPVDAGLTLGMLVAREPITPPRPDQDGPCLPETDQLCHQGDVWLVDSCGNLEEKLEECDTRLCNGDSCDEPSTEPCSEPLEGRCDRDIVRMCLAGRVKSVDCAAKGLRCVMGDEGAECAELVPAAESCSRAPPRCEGDTLIRCEQGRIERTDCQAVRSKCLQLAGGKAPSCVQIKPPVALLVADCGPCGCVSVAGGQETSCDGHDDDNNGLVDDRIACGPVPVVAFIITSASGQTNHSREDVENELLVANRAFARELPELSLSFVLADLFFVADGALLDIDSGEFTQLANDPRIHPARDEFYVPMVFSDALSATGNTPRIGVSTLPNATCGGVQEGQGPDVGLLAVAKARSPTTVIHELGHFLGLCHTHDRQASALLAARDSSGALVACGDTCRGDGDGVCDTPFDPGPELCAFDVACQTACQTSALPDTGNLMSYYTPCRQHFSVQQMQLMQHSLALRRGWHRCLGGSCACSLGGDECPVGMSCLPVALNGAEQQPRCVLAGPRRPGSDCQDATQCGAGAVCLSDTKTRVQRCVRACLASKPGCDCTQAREGLSVCIQDLTM